MDHTSTPVSRRTFIQVSSATAALAVPALTAVAAQTKPPSERLRIGFIGLGVRNNQHLTSAIKLQNDTGKIEIAAVCDVFSRYRDQAVKKVEEGVKHAPKAVSDYRDILADKSIDAVCIATPDHWHARQTLDALSAGCLLYTSDAADE